MKQKTQREKDYRKTWKYKIGGKHFPKDWLSANPVKIFGFIPFVIYRVAKENYEWSCSCGYQGEGKCRAKNHDTNPFE